MANKTCWLFIKDCSHIRVDVRLDADGNPRVLDVNPNPELSTGVGIHRAVAEAGWSWERFVKQQIVWARV